MNLKDSDKEILAYISREGKVLRKDIMNNLNIASGSLSDSLRRLENANLIKITKQGNQTIIEPMNVFEESNEDAPHIQIPIGKTIDSIGGISAYIKRLLRKHNWSSTSYSVPLTALLIAKYTKLRLIIFGSQASGKSTCINAVFRDNKGRILEDLHRRKLEHYVNMVKNYTNIIEEQYLHDWRREDTKNFDKYRVIPTSKIAPTEFLFRFIPLRILQPDDVKFGFQFFTVDIKDFKLASVPEDVQKKFKEKLGCLKYFSNDESLCSTQLELIKQRRIQNLYDYGETVDNLNARQWKIENEYRALERQPIIMVNSKVLQNIDDMWLPVSQDMQLVMNAYELLRFSYSLNRDGNFAIKDAYGFLKTMLKTWTLVKEEPMDKESVKIRHSGTQSHYVDSAGVVHNVV